MLALSTFLDSPSIYVDESEAARIFPALVDAGLFELLEDIVSNGDLFGDCTVRNDSGIRNEKSLIQTSQEWTKSVITIIEYLAIIASGTQRWNGLDWEDDDPDDPDDDDVVVWVPPDLTAFRHRVAKLFSLTFQEAWDRQHLFKSGCRNDQYHLEGRAPSSADIRGALRGLLFMK